MKDIKNYNYDLRTENGGWLGRIVLTSDGMFASVTDWGNFSFAWGTYSRDGEDFRKFILGLNIPYFGTKMYGGISYVAHGKKIEQACDRFAEKILPPLQEAIRKELEAEENGN